MGGAPREGFRERRGGNSGRGGKGERRGGSITKDPDKNMPGTARKWGWVGEGRGGSREFGDRGSLYQSSLHPMMAKLLHFLVDPITVSSMSKGTD